ncbi:MAG: squalene/phytoene synthase family protein [Pseudomonadota bacterium]
MTDRDLVRHYWPVELRPAFDALFAIDDVMGEVVASSTQPALGAIRLAWWREALERLDPENPPPEPRLQAAARELLKRGVSRSHLAGIAEGWATWLDETPDPDMIAGRGESLFAAGACLLRATDPRLLEAGSLFAFGNAKRSGLGPFDHSRWSMRFDRSLRSLTAFAALGARDLLQDHLEPEATPGRALTLIRHRLTGRITWPD